MGQTPSRSFIRGALILSIAGLLSKFLGFIYRIILTRILGAEGIGLFELAYPIYVALLTVSRSGIPVALARLVAEAEARNEACEALGIFRTARFLSIIIGAFFTVALMASTGALIHFLGWDPRVRASIFAIAPAIFFVSIMAAYRGYFQGFQRMGPTGASQVVEQAVRMVTMIGLVLLLAPLGLEYAAAGATFGAVSGAVAGLFVMVWYFKKSGHAPGGLGFLPGRDIMSRGGAIARVAVPVTVGALVFPLMRLVDAIIIPARLQVAGWSIIEVTPLYGTLATALVLVNFPTIITVALAASLVPSISEVHTLNKREELSRRIDTALRLSVIIGLPASGGLFILAEPLTRVIFDLPAAATPLRVVAWGVLFIALQQTSSAILQGVGRVKRPAVNLLFGALLNAVINFTLTAVPAWGIKGAALGTTLGFALAAGLNLFDLMRLLQPRLKWKLFIAPFAAAAVMMAGVMPVFSLAEGFFGSTGWGYATALLGAVLTGMILFFLFLLLLGGLVRSDFLLIPRYGERIADWLINLKLMRR